MIEARLTIVEEQVDEAMDKLKTDGGASFSLENSNQVENIDEKIVDEKIDSVVQEMK